MARFLLNLSHSKLLWTLCVLSVVGQLVAQTSQTSHTHPVIRVVDGDTVVLSLDGVKTRVRLIGIDTPETVHPQKPVEHYGQEASTFLKNLLRGESVSVEYEPGAATTDQYGRTLAYLYRAPDGLFVNAEIVRQGYGHAYTRFPFKYMEEFREYERIAREAGKGLWGQSSGRFWDFDPQPPRSPYTIEETELPTDSKSDALITVYVTKTGKKYHKAGCRDLSKSKIASTLVDAKTRYAACKVCLPPN